MKSEPRARNLIVYALGILFFAARAFACDICAVYAATQARGEGGKGFYGGAAEQFTHFGTLQFAGAEVSNPTGQYLDSSIAQVFAGYNFNNRFGIQFNAPVIYRSFKRPDGFSIDHGTEAGVGDVSLIGKYRLRRHLTETSTLLWDVLGGVKFPSGSASRLKEELNEVETPGAPESGSHGHDLTLGSGSWDGLVGTSVYWRWKRVFFNGGTQYSIRSEGDLGYQFANDLTWNGGPGFLLILNEDFTLSLQANVSGETKGRDTFRRETAADTGITIVYLGPQIAATWSDKLSIEIGADIPVSRDNTALQIVPDYRLRAALIWHF